VSATLKIDGKDLSTAAGGTLARCLASLEYASGLDLLDSMTARFVLADGDDLKKALSSFLPGMPFELGLGTLSWKGDVTRVAVDAPSGAAVSVTVFGMEPLHRLRHTRVTRFEEKAKDQIAKAILAEAGVRASAQAVKATAEETVLMDERALSLVKRFADERNFAIVFDGTALSFSPRNAAATGDAVKLAWGTDVADLRLAADISEVVTSVKMFGRDYLKTDPPISQEAKKVDLKSISDKAKTGVDCRAKIGECAVVLDRQLHAATTSELKELAVGELQRRAETFLSGQVVVRGAQAAKPLQKLQIDNAPWPLMGPFLVRGATWSWSGARPVETTIDFFSDSYPKAA
jgi:phage protein D